MEDHSLNCGWFRKNYLSIKRDLITKYYIVTKNINKNREFKEKLIGKVYIGYKEFSKVLKLHYDALQD